ncbi:hypothetical protein PV08_09206 [Exophiala spinifera]|uniref:Uncharacterized protein n=1 Tax=Exophiala spinifera TaxID=91928 RepID=A0A0D2AZ09_9EURO|nr:uncharacterized protein PV08_09206 [Exophiala spinifera]KIW11933.1 hypothetical protein PV08_09206 [Exophiala spinifera]
MDVLSIESCVQTALFLHSDYGIHARIHHYQSIHYQSISIKGVLGQPQMHTLLTRPFHATDPKDVIGAFLDAAKLVQRLQQKAATSEEFILPEDLIRDFETSLSLGSITVKSQYDHDFRRFGETYARGDSIAREQMKDVVITLQKVNTHLREVFMDDASLDLTMLKETSDDSRVNAIVCLGQLYQRMSTAAASMKEMSRSYRGGNDQHATLNTLAYSSSQSTNSSLARRPWDSRSSTSYTSCSTRTAVEGDRKPSNELQSQRRMSLTSAFSYSSEREPYKSRVSEEDVTPKDPPPVQRHSSQSQLHDQAEITCNGSMNINDAKATLTTSPEPRRDLSFSPPGLTPLVEDTTDTEPTLQQSAITMNYDVQGSGQSSPRSPGSQIDVKVSPPVSTSSLHELENTIASMMVAPLATNQQNRVPMNPEYSTLECVPSVGGQWHPVPPVNRQGYLQQDSQQIQTSHLSSNHTWPIAQSQPTQIYPESEQTTYNDIGPVTMTMPINPAPTRAFTGSSIPRPLSIRSSSSAGSKVSGFTLRKALPPGIVGAIHKNGSSANKAQVNDQPRYVKPQSRPPPVHSSELASDPIHTVQASTAWMKLPQASVRPVTASSESVTRAPSSPHLHKSRSELNLPSESNLAGFCKGAVRQQLGGRKKAFTLDHRKPRKGHEWFFKCTKCNFAGPATVSAALPSGGRGAVKREKTFDTSVRKTPEGIQYRWAFLAKSHVFNKAHHSDLINSDDVYGCYICCAEGVGKGWLAADSNLDGQTPTFSGLQAFMAHLETHRAPHRVPGLMVANELNCIVGRVASENEDFDLNLPPLVM